MLKCIAVLVEKHLSKQPFLVCCFSWNSNLPVLFSNIEIFPPKNREKAVYPPNLEPIRPTWIAWFVLLCHVVLPSFLTVCHFKSCIWPLNPISKLWKILWVIKVFGKKIINIKISNVRIKPKKKLPWGTIHAFHSALKNWASNLWWLCYCFICLSLFCASFSFQLVAGLV